MTEYLKKIPVWLISLAVVLFMVVILERLYIARVPVRIFGIELNQPAVPEAPLNVWISDSFNSADPATYTLGPYKFCALAEAITVSGNQTCGCSVARGTGEDTQWRLAVSTDENASGLCRCKAACINW